MLLPGNYLKKLLAVRHTESKDWDSEGVQLKERFWKSQVLSAASREKPQRCEHLGIRASVHISECSHIRVFSLCVKGLNGTGKLCSQQWVFTSLRCSQLLKGSTRVKWTYLCRCLPHVQLWLGHCRVVWCI